jgi:hypothetical protein
LEYERRTLSEDAQRALDERSEQHLAEKQGWTQEREHFERLAEERGRFQREVGQLRDRLEEVSRARAKAESELATITARRDDDQRKLEAHWRHQQEQLLADAERKSGRDVVAERERWRAEREALAREVERLRSDAANVLASGRQQWERERTEAEARWAEERQDLRDETERRLLDQRVQLENERQAGKQEVDVERESLANEIQALKSLLTDVRRERDGALSEASAKDLDGERLGARLGQVEAALRKAGQDHRAERDRLLAALEESRRESRAAASQSAERGEVVRQLRGELEQRQRDHQAAIKESQRRLDASRRASDAERQQWAELMDAANPPDQVDPARDAANADSYLRVRAGATDLSISGRPQSVSYEDPERFRTDVEVWLENARTHLENLAANPAGPGSETRTSWLAFEMRTARAELERLPASAAAFSREPSVESIVRDEEA